MSYVHSRVGRAKPLTGWLPDHRVREFGLRLRDGTDLRLRTTDWVLLEVFGGAYALDLSPLGRVKTVLDLGANVGLASVYLARRLTEASFVCVEPSAESFRLLRENLRRNVPQAQAFRAAVVAKPGAYRLEEADVPSESRVVTAESGASEGGVEAMTIAEVMTRAGIETVDLMKMDIEGGEAALFESAGEWAPRVRALVAEVHHPLTVKIAEGRLSAHGFVSLPRPAGAKFERIVYMARKGAVGR